MTDNELIAIYMDWICIDAMPVSKDKMFRFNRAQLQPAPTLIEASYTAVVEWIKDYNEGVYTTKTPTP